MGTHKALGKFGYDWHSTKVIYYRRYNPDRWIKIEGVEYCDQCKKVIA